MTTVYNGSYIGNELYYIDDLELSDLMEFGVHDIGFRLPSIQNDVEKITAEHTHLNSLSLSDDIDIKPEIRNGDCMWSAFVSSGNGGCGTHGVSSGSNLSNNSNSAASSYSESSAVPPAFVSGTLSIKRELEDEDQLEEEQQQEQDLDHDQDNDNDSNSENHPHNSISHNTKRIRMNSCRSTVIGGSSKVASITATPTILIPSRAIQRDPAIEAYIPPGGSLLRKSNTQQKQQQRITHLLGTSSSSSSHSSNSSYAMPEDEVMSEVFRHNVDLRACVMGSNNISLTSSSDANIIDHLSRELQNTSKERIDLPYRIPIDPPIISDVLEVLNQQAQQSSFSAAAAATLSPPATTATSSDSDSDYGDCSMRHISDHSYTRCNEVETNLDTPSDSDEEIDVVSLNDKKLPTNPSDRDRRVLQTKVAKKISSDNRIVAHRSSRHYELPYTPASSSPVKSVANSRYPSPSSTPYQGAGAVSSSSSSDCLSPPISAVSASKRSRKPFYMPDINDDLLTAKRHPRGYLLSKKRAVKRGPFNSYGFDGKDVRNAMSHDSNCAASIGSMSSSSSLSTTTSSSSSNSHSHSHGHGHGINSNTLKRHLSVDEADTIEKRNLHNDMERQRRIGLKNLFEALKTQIPNIRDKERAPKVNILREAARLCEQLTTEERDLNVKRQLLKAKLKQQQEQLARLRLSLSKNGAE